MKFFGKRLSIANFFPVSVLAALSLALVGCGGGDSLNRGSVSGKATLDGVPVAEGQIAFMPTEGTQAPSAYGTIKDGKYAISSSDGPVEGRYSVRIEWHRDTGKKSEMGSPIIEQVVPAKFNQESTLSVQIVKGANVHDFEMSTK